MKPFLTLFLLCISVIEWSQKADIIQHININL